MQSEQKFSYIYLLDLESGHIVNQPIRNMLKRLLPILMICLGSLAAAAQQTQTLYLSGTGLDDTVTWQFRCSDGQNSGKWSTIEVPSQWELQGYGQYTYGFSAGFGVKPLSEFGEYRYNFKVPAAWRGRNVRIVFEGVMTDTDVRINGKSAGPVHQGSFYRFSYDVTGLLKYGGTNKLEVTVHKESANASVNSAERRADWWNFGGIYRPVYLTATAPEHIAHQAIDARADGSMTVDLETENAPEGAQVRFSLAPLTAPAAAAQSHTLPLKEHLEMSWSGIAPWECEHPNLYVLKTELLDAKGGVLHELDTRVGFRTVELRPRDGLYVNGAKVVLKGVNRHVFHPEGGRCSSPAISRSDAQLVKQMNMNAIRSHYPPDDHFLDACDSLGIFYLDELAGWHGRYDDEVGPIVVEEMVRRDVNHPSVIIWDNGNEGGWNTHLDPLFTKFDPQKRHVIHPWADFDDLDTHHYPTYLTGVARFTNGYKVFMPTEFMHTNSDQGGGAGLEDFWESWSAHPLFAGGFIWAFVDEAVVRTDKDGILDTNMDQGNDGVVGPYREKEGSFWAIREIWAPIQFRKLIITPSWNGDFYLTNKYLFTRLDACTMQYRVKKIGTPVDGAQSTITASGSIKVPALERDCTGIMHLDLPAGFFENDLLELEAFDEHGKSVCTWTWPIRYADDYLAAHGIGGNSRRPSAAAPAVAAEQGGKHILSARGTSVEFDAETGELARITRNGKEVPFGNMRTVGMKMRFTGGVSRRDGDDAVYVAKYLGAVDSIVWRLTRDGRLGLDAVLLNRDNGGVRGGFDDGFMDTDIKDLGFTFDYPKEGVTGMQWMGRGPYRVWKNRQRGHNIDLWHKDYNETVTGRAVRGQLEYPEFKGYHGNVYWLRMESETAPFTLYSATDGLFVKVFNPDEVQGSFNKFFPELPEGDISLLLDIQAIKSFKPIPQQGPHSQPGNIRIKSGDEGLRMKVWFDFQ